MKHNQITFLLLLIIFVFASGCNKNPVTEPAKDTEKPTVSILFPGSGSDVKADTTYTVIADANDNIKVTNVDFYINGQYAGSDSLTPYEYRWSTQGLTGSPTIMAKAYDEAGNIGTSEVITVRINGAANHAPITPSNPTPADSSVGQLLSPMLRWSCSDPDGDALTYDVFFDTSKSPTTQVATGQSAVTLIRAGLSSSTKYYWRVVAKDNRGGTTTGVVWNFTTSNPPAFPSNPNPTDAAVGVSTSPTLSWTCSDPDGDALTYDVLFDTNNPPTTQVASGQSAATLARTGLSRSTRYYWRVNAKDSKGATTGGTVWSFTTAANTPPNIPSNPSPANASTGISTIATLSWTCSDPDGDALTYDILFDTNNPPIAQVASGQSASTLACTGLSSNTKYYWKVVAKDSKGAMATGTVWSFTTGVIPLSMIPVAGGTFQMGSNYANDQASPIHSVTVGSFYIDKYEITYELWTEVRDWGLTHGYTDLTVGWNGFNYSGPVTGTNNPVTVVNWFDVVKWCNARSEKDGLTPVYYTSNTLSTVYRTGQPDLYADAVKWSAVGYRLPTEAEWEFAARGGNLTHGYTYSGSDTIDDIAWYYFNSGNMAHTVGTKAANELGIYDMSGNEKEWCWDILEAYSTTVQTDPKGAMYGNNRVTRGGSFFSSTGSADGCRVTYRGSTLPSDTSPYVGFRCVQD